MFHRRDTDALIVGAGPVGLFAALSLAQAGAKVEIVDREWRTAAHAYALALHPSSLELLDKFGLAQPVVARGRRIDRIAFYEGADRRAELSLATLPGAYPYVVVLPQSELEDLLVAALHERRVEVAWSHRVAELVEEEAAVGATIERLGKASTGYAAATTEWAVEKVLRTRAAYVVGADGHDSVVRRTLGIDYVGLGEPSLYAVFEFTADREVEPELRVVLEPGRTSVLWPLPGRRARWSFAIDDSGARLGRRSKERLAVQIGGRSFPHLDEDALPRLAAERAPWFDARVVDVDWSLLVRFQGRLASRFGRGRLWLAGDAAHMTGPVGVHSMNVGLAEAHEVGMAISQILRGQESGDVLEIYGRERLLEWRRLVDGEVAARAGSDAGRWLRADASRILSCIPASGPDLEHLAAQLTMSGTPGGRVS